MRKQLPYLMLVLVSIFLTPSVCAEERPPEITNKLLQMYRLYYLPFSIEFKQGKAFNDIFPMGPDKYGQFSQLLKPEDLQIFDKEYARLREGWKKKSLFLNTPLDVGESNHLTQKLVSHHIPLNRTAWDKVSVSERIQINGLLEGKPETIKENVAQVEFLHSFLKPMEDEKFNFFIVGPSWCESSREYRYILENYLKMFPNQDLVLHSVIIEDPKEEIFDSKILRDLFPHPEKYSHQSVPRFLAYQKVNGTPKVWEEGDALKELIERYYKDYRGFSNPKVNLFRNVPENSTPAVPPVVAAFPTR